MCSTCSGCRAADSTRNSREASFCASSLIIPFSDCSESSSFFSEGSADLDAGDQCGKVTAAVHSTNSAIAAIAILTFITETPRTWVLPGYRNSRARPAVDRRFAAGKRSRSELTIRSAPAAEIDAERNIAVRSAQALSALRDAVECAQCHGGKVGL